MGRAPETHPRELIGAEIAAKPSKHEKSEKLHAALHAWSKRRFRQGER
jgi:hypothetical protein